jgi:hypothetical protein
MRLKVPYVEPAGMTQPAQNTRLDAITPAGGTTVPEEPNVLGEPGMPGGRSSESRVPSGPPGGER